MAYDMYAPALWRAHTALCNLPKTKPCSKENGDVVAHVLLLCSTPKFGMEHERGAAALRRSKLATFRRHL